MRFLLTAINAKYIHSNLGVYSLKAYAGQEVECEKNGIEIQLAEYTINNQMDGILRDIYVRKPDMIGISCYIWNISYVRRLIRDIPKVLPDTKIWLGGPEVSYDAEKFLKEEPTVTGIMMGEGEETFADLLRQTAAGKAEGNGGTATPEAIPGTAVRTAEGAVRINPPRPLLDMDKIPFVYSDLTDFQNRIIYYESSRGCPFSCSYCLSSIDKSVRFRSLEKVLGELDFFLEKKVPQVKFVDRTFNCKKSHAMAVWRHILEHDNGITNFHFEISADLLGEEEMELIGKMRPGLIQLEIGVQTTNDAVIKEIRRTMNLDRLKAVVSRINSGGNVHQHLDLIAGLPCEGMESFQKSFNEVYRMEPEQLQLGFLKVLKGSYMAEMAEEYELLYTEEPPFEVLSTKWLGYEEIIELKKIEEMVEVHYNSNQFGNTLKELEGCFESPYQMFQALVEEYESRGLLGINHNRAARYEILYRWIERGFPDKLEKFRDLLTLDLYLRENLKSRPGFLRDQTAYKTAVRDFFIDEAKNHRYLKGYEEYDSRQTAKMAHLEVLGDGRCLLFDYKNRDALTYSAGVYLAGLWNGEEIICPERQRKSSRSV